MMNCIVSNIEEMTPCRITTKSKIVPVSECFRIDPASQQVELLASSFVEPNLKSFASTDFNKWLADLPKEDWSEEISNAIPVRWDPEKGWIDNP